MASRSIFPKCLITNWGKRTWPKWPLSESNPMTHLSWSQKCGKASGMLRHRSIPHSPCTRWPPHKAPRGMRQETLVSNHRPLPPHHLPLSHLRYPLTCHCRHHPTTPMASVIKTPICNCCVTGRGLWRSDTDPPDLHINWAPSSVVDGQSHDGQESNVSLWFTAQTAQGCSADFTTHWATNKLA